MQTAVLASEHSNRTPSEQVEYWALLGRSVGKSISIDDMLGVRCGLAQLKVEEVIVPAVDADAVFDSLEIDRQSGALSKSITDSPVRYQASCTHPGQLEKIDADGHITIGRFSKGVFTPMV